MILSVGYYHDADDRRRGEIGECLRRNAANPRLAEVHVLLEDDSSAAEVLAQVHPQDRAKVRVVEHRRRLTYADLFAYANAQLRDETVVIANADVFFDDTLGLLDGHDLFGQLLCLSRWDEQPDGTTVYFDHPGSQDAWIFESPVRQMSAGFHLGTPGCDSRIAAEAQRVGMRISNPSRSIVVHHLHRSSVHRYTERDRIGGPAMHVAGHVLPRPRETIYALTSLPPDVRQAATVTACLDSWRRAGLHVVGFNHPLEIAALQRTYAIDFVAVAETTEEVFGRPFVPINAMLDWAHRRSVPVLLINADITLALEPWELRRMRWLARDGLCYLSRYNHDGDLQRACREPWGIDGFLLHGVDAALFAPSFMSMGQPFWDYWLPHVFSRHGRPLHTAGFAAAYHRNHPTQWSWENWHRCALEFARVTGEDDVERLGDCHLFSISTRQAFEAGTNVLAQAPTGIQQWVESQFADGRPKLFVELGAHRGTDTEWMARLANVHIHAFEPDPRNEQPPRPNVTMHRAAISDNDGPGSLILSAEGWGREWTYSSSIKQPKHHLERYPVTFGGAVPVEMVTLDAFCAREGIGCIDFIWADIQGAEGEMIRGGLDALSRTRYLYTEYSDDELYDGQVTLAEILRLLPQFRVVELWPDDVLLVNTSLS